MRITVRRVLCLRLLACGSCQLLNGHRGQCLCDHFAAGGVEVPARTCEQ